MTESEKQMSVSRVHLECVVRCVGADNKQHVRAPESNICKCGMKVKRKNLLRDDHLLFGCYECTY